MKWFALITTVVLLVLSFLVIGWRLQSVVFIFLVALIIATTLEQPADLLTARGWPRWLAVLALYGGSLLGIAAIAAFVLNALAREIDPFVQELLSQYALFEQRLAAMTDERQRFLIPRLPTTQNLAAMIVTNPETGVADGIVAGAQRFLGMVGELAGGEGTPHPLGAVDRGQRAEVGGVEVVLAREQRTDPVGRQCQHLHLGDQRRHELVVGGGVGLGHGRMLALTGGDAEKASVRGVGCRG